MKKIRIKLPIVLEVVDYKAINALAPLGDHLIIAIPKENCEIIDDEEDPAEQD